MNGNMEGDEEGELTYVGKRGASVIDYGSCNTTEWEKVSKFYIDHRTEADHQSIIIEVETEGGLELKEERRMEKEIIVWNEKSIEEYMNSMQDKVFRVGESVNEAWTELKGVVKENMEVRKMILDKEKIGQNYWWDKECSREKRRVDRYNKRWRTGKVKERNM